MRCLSAPKSRSSPFSLSARCRQASTATRPESALGDFSAMLCISTSTLCASSSTSFGSPCARRVYGWPRIVTRTVFLSDGTIRALTPAELVYLSQKFFDAAAHLFALRAQGLHLGGKLR